MKTTLDPLSLSHFKGLCVTGGNQPYLYLAEAFREEIISGPTWAEPGFLDAPTFMPTGSTIEYDGFDHRAVLQGITLIEAR